MREHLDCAILASPLNEGRALRLQGSHAGGRLLIRQLESDADSANVHALAEAAMLLRRYDVCLLRVCPANLSWVRTNLQAARPLLSTPLIALTRDLKAAALDDLHKLGVDDFLREPFCAEELRARCERLLGRQQARVYVKDIGPQPVATTAASAEALSTPEPSLAYPLDHGVEALTASSLESYAVAAVGDAQGPSLRAAKTQIVERFETAYIKAALHRHQGNIAMAARSVQKHRRAFWALMHKYKIDPMPYRAMGRSLSAPCGAGKMPANFSEG